MIVVYNGQGLIRRLAIKMDDLLRERVHIEYRWLRRKKRSHKWRPGGVDGEEGREPVEYRLKETSRVLEKSDG